MNSNSKDFNELLFDSCSVKMYLILSQNMYKVNDWFCMQHDWNH